MSKAVDVETPIFLQGVSLDGYIWGDVRHEGKLSDLGVSAEQIAELEGVLTEKVLNGEFESTPDWGVASSETVRGLTDGPVPLYNERNRTGRQYAPVEEQPHLFRTFAELDLSDEEAIKNFTNKYGFLGLKQTGYLDGAFVYFEQYEDWFRAIAEVRGALTLYDTFMGDDYTSQSHLISEDEWGGFALDLKVAALDLGRRLTPRSYPPSVWEKAKGDYQLLFKLFFFEIVNEKLSEYCLVRLHVQGDVEELDFGIRNAPWNLLGALWLQVAMMAERKVTYKKCGFCGRTISLADTRKDTVYCKSAEDSSACRTKASAQRKAQTLELSAQGLEVEEIARTVGSKRTQVAKWIKSVKAERKPS